MTVSSKRLVADSEHGDPNLHVLPQTKQLRALHTIVRDRDATRDDLVFYSGRIMRLLIECALDLLPYAPWEVQTPVGETYAGLRLPAPVCGVSVIRAGDSMEGALRSAWPSVRIGKILIQRDKVTKLPQLFYKNLPHDIAERHVLLLDSGVAEGNIIFVSLIAAPEGIAAVRGQHPELPIVTSSVEERLNENAYMIPGIGDFGDRYFGTDGKSD